MGDVVELLQTIFYDRFSTIINEALTYSAELGYTPNDDPVTRVEAFIDTVYGVTQDRSLSDFGWDEILITALSNLDDSAVVGLPHLLTRKRTDYGHANITKFGVPGICIRMWDKCARLRNLGERGGRSEVGESIKDAWMDIAGYLCIMRLVELGLLADEIASR